MADLRQKIRNAISKMPRLSRNLAAASVLIAGTLSTALAATANLPFVTAVNTATMTPLLWWIGVILTFGTMFWTWLYTPVGKMGMWVGIPGAVLTGVAAQLIFTMNYALGIAIGLAILLTLAMPILVAPIFAALIIGAIVWLLGMGAGL